MPHNHSTRSSFATGFILAVTAGVGCAAAMIMLYTVYDELMDEQMRQYRQSVPFEQIRLTASGQPIYEIDGGNPEHLDLDRNPLELDEPVVQMGRLHELDVPDLRAPRNRVDLTRKRVVQLQTGIITENWFFVLDEEKNYRGYFVGYDRKTALPVGYLGTDGFQDSPPDQQFEVYPAMLLRRGHPGLVQW